MYRGVDGVVGGVEKRRASADIALPRAFEDFYRSDRDRIVRAVALAVGDADLASEAVDEAMARAYQRWARIGRYDSAGGWVYRVALNWATSVLRRRGRTPRLPAIEPVMDPQPGEPSLLAALAELDLAQRSVIVLRFYLGQSEAEIAATLGVRPGTVKSRLHRGLQRLQTRLAHLAPEDS